MSSEYQVNESAKQPLTVDDIDDGKAWPAFACTVQVQVLYVDLLLCSALHLCDLVKAISRSPK